MRDDRPSCTIDFRREFTLPVAVPPESIAEADAIGWSLVVDAAAANLRSTFGRYYTTAPTAREVREAQVDGVAAARIIMPRFTGAPAVSAEADLPAAISVVKTTFVTKPPASGTREVVEGELQSSVTHDATSRGFAVLPIPFADLDTLRIFWADRAGAGFAGTFGINDDGPIRPDGTLSAALPSLLLRTATDQNAVELGEVDRLVLRAPVSGRFRFEPYFIYRRDGATFGAVGPSNSGRVTIQQPSLSTRERDEKTDTQVYKQRLFAFEHVDRGSVATVIDRSLALHLAWIELFVSHFGGAKADQPRLTIPKSSPEVLEFVLSDVNHLLRAWLAFLFSIRWRAEDVTAAGGIPADWAAKLPLRNVKAEDAPGIIDIVKATLADGARAASLRWFSSTVYTRRLAGFTWSEIIGGAGQDPETLRFPVPGNQPPYAPRDATRMKQFDLLRLVDNPEFRWIGCYAGSPVGRPSRVYAQAAAAGTTFPAGGLTSYEIEALHAAGASGAALGIAQPADAGPRPGYAMDLAPYAAKATGFACCFSAQRLAANPLHTVIDFLVELTQGIHFHSKERPFVDIQRLIDPASGRGHPLREPLHSDDFLRATHLRRQMDSLAATTIGGDAVDWWTAHVNMPGEALGPRHPFKLDDTHPRRFSGQMTFAEVFPPPIGAADITGFDELDLTSAMLAAQRTSQLGVATLPLPVLLGLMDREGVRVFGAVNRHVRNTTVAANTQSWEALFRDPAATPAPRARGSYPAGDDAMAREAWLSYPYGLDTFAVRQTDGAFSAHFQNVTDSDVLTLEPGEDPGKYIRDRVFASWVPISAAAGVPAIWKRSRRVHWACLSLMAGWFQKLENDMHNAAEGFVRPGWPDVTWLPPGSSPPSLLRGDGTRVGPNDQEWKDFLSYYGMIYIAYNASPNTFINFLDGVDAALPGGWAFTKRDFLLFRHSRGNAILKRMVRLVIAIDAYMRLDYMAGKTPAQYAGSAAIATALDPARWGIP